MGVNMHFRKINNKNELGVLPDSYWSGISQNVANMILDSGNLTSLPSSEDLSFNPIGAFYDSQSTRFDNAASIASATGVLFDNTGNTVSQERFGSFDSNGDGVISMSEASSLRMLIDANENGILDMGELVSVTRTMDRAQWSVHTQGNGVEQHAANGLWGCAA